MLSGKPSAKNVRPCSLHILAQHCGGVSSFAGARMGHCGPPLAEEPKAFGPSTAWYRPQMAEPQT